MSEAEVVNQVAPVADDQINLQQQDIIQNDSEGGEQGGDTNSEMGNSVQSAHLNSEVPDDQSSDHLPQSDSQNRQSSRGSTKATGDDDSFSVNSAGGFRQGYAPADPRNQRRSAQDQEPDRDEYGHPLLTNRYLRDLFRVEWRKYYRTPELNEKLFLHFKGFSKIQNLGQFNQLKCLYFEGNGCDSLLGLEENHELRSLFIQENAIRKMEGLQNMRELRQLNLSENFLSVIEGLEGCTQLNTLYMKRNRIGSDERGDIECLKGLLGCPTLNCVDISENNIQDPAVLEEVIYKMPNLTVLYMQGNPVCRKIDYYRKKIISDIPNLKYLDDRPVFEEDRRRAEAWRRGGMEAERAEMKKIKKEKEDKHWAQHEAFQIMIHQAKKDREDKQKNQEGDKETRKETMKDMMARAKAEKEAKGKVSETTEKLDGVYKVSEDKEGRGFFEKVDEKAKQRYQEKQAGVVHSEAVPSTEEQDQLENEKRERMKQLAKEYDETDINESLKPMPKSVDDFGHKKKDEEVPKRKPKTFKELEEEWDKKNDPEAEEDNEDDDAPDLEEVDQEELERTKKQKAEEWLNNILDTQEASKKEAQKQAKKDEAAPDKADSKDKEAAPEEEDDEEADDSEEVEAILKDEKRVLEAQAEVNADNIRAMMNEQADVVEKARDPDPDSTNFDELD